MRLEELLNVISENKDVIIFIDGKEVSRYDGRNSINPKYNQKTVCHVDCSDNVFLIEIK